MCSRILGPLVFALLAQGGLARPIGFVPGFGLQEEDVATVESLRRDVREPAPLLGAAEVQDLLGLGNAPRKEHEAEKRMKNAAGKSDEGGYYKTFGSDAEGEKGYLKETYSKGDHGYKTFDTFHKRDGDKYGFEKHTAFGKARSGNKGGHHADEDSSSKKSNDHEGEGTIVDSHYVGAEGDDHGAAETSHYSEGGDGDHHYSGHYSQKGPESANYGHSESYSGGGGGEGAYENHSSYSSSHGDKEGYEGGHY
ncbi:hypothetical protein KM043_005127 [Ampulex compressa]|nr:hypothetical protein KM043_005127 [Ampulex compressa]